MPKVSKWPGCVKCSVGTPSRLFPNTVTASCCVSKAKPLRMPNVFERFARAKELVQLRSLASLEQARHLLWMCIAENPNYAPAWAWLGRCSWRLAKLLPSNFSGEGLTPLAFRRAFLLDPELAVAHQFFYTISTRHGQSPRRLNSPSSPLSTLPLRTRDSYQLGPSSSLPRLAG